MTIFSEFEGSNVLALEKEGEAGAGRGLLDLFEAAEGSGKAQCWIVACVELTDGCKVVSPCCFGIAGVYGRTAAHVSHSQLDEGVVAIVGEALGADE